MFLQVLLSNGDLAINASTHVTPPYECVASFNTADGGLQNVTLAVYNMASPYGEGSGIGNGMVAMTRAIYKVCFDTNVWRGGGCVLS